MSKKKRAFVTRSPWIEIKCTNLHKWSHTTAKCWTHYSLLELNNERTHKLVSHICSKIPKWSVHKFQCAKILAPSKGDFDKLLILVFADADLFFKVARNEVENASFAQHSAHRDSRIWRPELIESAAERKRRARRRRPTSKSAHPDPQILTQCNISSNYPLQCVVFLSQQT